MVKVFCHNPFASRPRGGMGVVYEAEQISLGRRVALKVLPLAATLSDQQLDRFKNEARTAATLKHSHIVAVYSVGVERGVHYYTMELVEGRRLPSAAASESVTTRPWWLWPWRHRRSGSRDSPWPPAWLAEQRISLAFSTYQSGKLFLIGLKPDGQLSVFERTFNRCMGLWSDA